MQQHQDRDVHREGFRCDELPLADTREVEVDPISKATASSYQLKVTTGLVNHTFANGDWTFNLGASNTNAWSAIKAAKLAGPAPAKGYSYVMAKLTLAKKGKKAIDPRSLTSMRIATDTDDYFDSCGKLPSDFAATLGPLKAGQTRSGNVCIAVRTSDLSTAFWTVFGATDAGDVSRFDLAVKLH